MEDLKSDRIYHRLCKAAGPLQKWKHKKGFQEGDWFLDEQGEARLCGMDYLLVRQGAYRGYPRVEFMVLEKMEVGFSLTDMSELEFVPKDATLNKGSYILKSIFWPIWLPSSDQLLKILEDNGFPRYAIVHEISRSIDDYPQIISLRNHLLIFVMARIFHETYPKMFIMQVLYGKEP